MPELATLLPVRRPELLIRPLGDEGQHVIKDPRSGAFFHFGKKEHFLLLQLEGKLTVGEVRVAFTERFGEPLSEDDLDAFIDLVRSQGLLQSASGAASASEKNPALTPSDSPARQSILHWRRSFWDPDRLFGWLVARIGFFWTPAFLVFSGGCILLAVLLVWANRHELAGSLAHTLRWETAVIVWPMLLLIGTVHECAHGLTCKRYGGEVHEIGFLMLFLLPCCYCNVSDAWLIREKSKRLWVTFAGGYFELFLWALAVFVWRLTVSGSLVNYMAFVVLSISGIQTLFNFIPLVKLDGYYLFSDALELPNLQERALDCFKGWIRRLLWGAPRPEREPSDRLLLGFGVTTWLCSFFFLVLALLALFRFLWTGWGWIGLGGVAVMGLVATRSLFQEFSAGELSKMIRLRRKRTVVWVLALAGLVAGLFLLPMQDRAGGAFQVRPLNRAELRAQVAGFLCAVYCEEGDPVSPGAPVARLEVSDLASRLAQKRAELCEVQAKVRLLEAGPRYEEVVEQRRRVKRAMAWYDLARQDLTRLRQVFEKELVRLDKHIAQCRAEVTAAQDAVRRVRSLVGKAVSAEQYQEVERRYQVCQSQLEQVQAEKHAREAKGTLEAETEIVRRERELADVQASLSLLEAGPRSEEVEAERARLARLQEELRYLEHLRHKLSVYSPIFGLVTTPRSKEKVGRYMREGELICVVEEPARLGVEITLAEQEVARVRPGQAVALRARALPFETMQAAVDRVAPTAGHGDAEGTVTVYCQFEEASSGLLPGMTGYAHISTGLRSIGTILADRALRCFRTEFWWW
jgi:multidrug efflux pump subunit AcrA (membrane-fusion protein)